MFTLDSAEVPVPDNDTDKRSGQPVANLKSNVTQGYVPLSALFTDLFQSATGRKWDIGNDETIESTGTSFVHEFTSAVTYTVNLTVSNANVTASKIISITVLNESGSSDGSNVGNSGRSNGKYGGGGSLNLQEMLKSRSFLRYSSQKASL